MEDDVQRLAREYADLAGKAIQARQGRMPGEAAELERRAQAAFERLRQAQGKPATRELTG